MIHSMTGFACKNSTTPYGQMNWEIRSVNHRYLDLHFHFPEKWRELETEMRPLLQEALGRGKVDIYLHFMNTNALKNSKVNIPVVEALENIYQQLQQHVSTLSPVNFFDLLQWPNVLTSDEQSKNEIKDTLLATFKEVLQSLVQQREREGKALHQLLQTKLVEIQEKLTVIKPRREQVLQEQRTKFLTRLETLQTPFDNNRLEQELLIWAQKSDINEEIERLSTHIQEAQKILKNGGKSIGRQLDFLLQEMNREINTLSSKSLDVVLTNAAVDVKVLLEQIREQLQNIA